MGSQRLLIVDDNQMVLDAVTLVLTRAGYAVDATTDVLAIRDRIGAFKPDAVLLDVDLPAITPDQLADTARSVRAVHALRLIYYSAEDEDKLGRLVIATGAAGYIPKGLGRPEFLGRLRAFLEAG